MFKNSGIAILFCLGIYLMINITVAFLIYDFVDFLQDAQKFSNNIEIFNWIALLWLIASIAIFIKAIVTREKFDLKLKLGSILLIAVIALNMVMSFL
ncbi:MAG: hypothetical protein R8G66_14965 [Cytophagales bacterium]|nr:hypothetical protein [Cytophagales bacterium]